MGKKGELTSKTIITIVILLIGFAILLFVLSQIFTKTDLDRQACHQSVVLRGSVAELSSVAKGYVPLKCKTGKYCVTADLFGKCEEFKTEKSVKRVIVNKKEDVEKAITEVMFDCWSMMGKGKLSIYSESLVDYGLKGAYSSCIVCGRIVLAEDIRKKWPIESINVNNYMLTHIVPGTEKTYFEYLSQGKSAVSVSVDFVEVSTSEESENERISATRTNKKISPKEEIAVTFMQISVPSKWKALLKTEAVVGIGGFGGAAFLSKGAVFELGASTLTKIIVPILAAVGIYTYFTASWNEAIAARYCGDVRVGDDDLRQCSIISLTNYDERGLAEYCNYIESIP